MRHAERRRTKSRGGNLDVPQPAWRPLRHSGGAPHAHGYARVSTTSQDASPQHDALPAAG